MEVAQSYLRIGRAADGEERYDRLLFRFFEMLPGLCSWGTFVLLFFLSWQKPVWVAVFIVAFDLYWFFRVIYFTIHAHFAYRKVKNSLATDWLAKLDNLEPSLYTLSISNWRDMYHLIILPVYKEPYEIVASSIRALKETIYPKEHFIVVLALEEGGGSALQEIARKITDEFAKDVGHFMVTVHPASLSGELQGKGANETWAARIVKRDLIDPLGILYENILVSTFDIDTVVFPQYFGCLTYTFLTTSKPLQTSFQPVSLFTNNIWDAPAISRVVAFATTYWQLLNQERKNRLLTFSSHSMNFKTLVDIDFWQTNVVSEDSRIFWQCFLYFNGEYKVAPLFYPVAMDANVASSFLKTIINIYKQQRRWAYGVGDVAYLFFGFLKNKKICLLKKFDWGLFTFEGYYSWATNAFILFLFGWIPVLLGPAEFRATMFAYTLPHITQFIMSVTMIGILSGAFMNMVLLPKKPPHISRLAYLYMIAQWILVPFISIFFSALPALEAQTRWMLGKYMGFWATEKFRSHHSR